MADERRHSCNQVVHGELPVETSAGEPRFIEHVLGAHAKGIGERQYATSAYQHEAPPDTNLSHIIRED